MTKRIIIPVAAVASLALLVGVLLLVQASCTFSSHEEIEPPEPDPDFLADDKLEDKHAEFDRDLVDSRLFEGQEVNKSAAIIKLDVTGDHSDTLYPSYAAAIKAAQEEGANILLSINYIDGKSKQVDDGLYAALNLAYYKGVKDTFESHVALIKRFYEATKADPECEAYFAAGLHYAGVEIKVADSKLKVKLTEEFESNLLDSRPIGFYTWSDDLQQCFRFMRFFIRPLSPSLTQKLCAVLEKDAVLTRDYDAVVEFYGRLSNYRKVKSLTDVIAHPDYPDIAKTGISAIFPESEAKESILFSQFFDFFGNLPANIDLMQELIKAIKDGKVDLTPDEKSGWYEYQVYALETLLLPAKGEEADKLLLTQNYKRRMVEAFKSMITTRREIHSLFIMSCTGRALPHGISPRLRVEPCPTYYKRQARGYAFLLNFLTATVGEEALSKMHGLRKEGEREMTLWDEIRWMRDFYYGLYLISCEDIGLRPTFMENEPVEQTHCIEVAAKWLEVAFDDEDMKIDTRVSIPVAHEMAPRTTHIWATIGVKLIDFEASFATPPSVRENKDAEWRVLYEYEMQTGTWVMPAVQFIEVERKGWSPLDREELRKICDREKTKDKIAAALANP